MGNTTYYTYESFGNVTQVEDSLTHVTATTFDALNRVQQLQLQ